MIQLIIIASLYADIYATDPCDNSVDIQATPSEAEKDQQFQLNCIFTPLFDGQIVVSISWFSGNALIESDDEIATDPSGIYTKRLLFDNVSIWNIMKITN